MIARKVRVIINPRAGSGKAERSIADIERALRRYRLSHELVRTNGPMDATRLVAEAIDDGVDVVAIVGGDGTLNEASRAFIDESGRPRRGRIPDLAIIPAGTGGDWRKTFGLSESIDDAVRRIANPTRRPVDLGLLRLETNDGKHQFHTFLNIASFGISGVADKLVNESPKWMGGKIAFFLGTLRASLAYRNAPVRVKVDGKTLVEGRIFVVAIANGRYFGGGMKIAPHADPSDGKLEVVVLGDLNRVEAFGLAPRIYQGTHLSMAKVQVASGASIEAEPLDGHDVWLDVDGETPGRLPVSATVLPSALHLCV